MKSVDVRLKPGYGDRINDGKQGHQILTDVKVAKLKYQRIESKGERNRGKLLLNRHPHRDGLYLAVSPPRKGRPGDLYGSKTWRYDYRWPPTATGKRQCLTYGRYPAMGLAEAYEAHLETRRLMKDGINPTEAKRQKKYALIEAEENVYEVISAKWLALEKKDKSKSWIDNNTRWAKWVNEGVKNKEGEKKAPGIGRKPIAAVSQDDIHKILVAIEELGFASSAERVRQQVSQVFEYAGRKRLFTGRNPAQDLKGEIKVPAVRSNPHIKAREIPEFLAAVDASKASAQTKAAAKLLLLTIVRKQELLAAKPAELDLDGATWEIPAERMKNGLPHIVPLSRQALELFRKVFQGTPREYLFPNTQRPRTFMGLSTLNVFFDRIGYADRLTPHGLRSLASTAMNEAGFRADVIERQLSHVEKNQVRRAYNKADYMDERKRLMQWWADYVDQLCRGKDEAKVVPFPASVAA